MIVEFIKDHPSGIGKGEIRDLEERHAQRLVKDGYCKSEKDSEPKKKLDNESETLGDSPNE